jgi:hypothetical protein
MSDDELLRSAEFYGVTMDEAREMHRKCMEQGDNPADPICIGCARRPHEIGGYLGCFDEDEHPTNKQVAQYVISEEGTYNRANGHFLCDACYIKNGMPSSDRGWVCP